MSFISRFVSRFVVTLGLMATIGCSHGLEIKNLSVYRSNEINSIAGPMAIGIVSNNEDPVSKRLVKAVGSALAKQAKVKLPYSRANSGAVDVVATINIVQEYKGSGWNFLINWPGFILFTPAWHGYNYSVNYDVDISLTKGAGGETIDSFSVPVYLNVRHASFNRTWTEISWLEVSAIAFIGGLVFMNYDNNVTPLVMEKIEGPIGDYLAQEIIARIKNLE